jgi:hypothetical protein
MYEIFYNNLGNPINIRLGNQSIPIDIHNQDFSHFLDWNSKQELPLDWKTSIEVEPLTPIPTVEERLAIAESQLAAIRKSVPADVAAKIITELQVESLNVTKMP